MYRNVYSTKIITINESHAFDNIYYLLIKIVNPTSTLGIFIVAA